MRRKPAGKNPTAENPKSEAKLDDPETLDKVHVALRTMFRKGELDAHDYYKSLMDLIARWILLGRREDAVSLLCELPEDYIAHGMPFQMEQDPQFKIKAHAVAAYLEPTIPQIDTDDVELAAILLKKPVAKA
jgi:hypothetical protein